MTLLFDDEILQHEEMVKTAMAMPLNVKIDKALGLLDHWKDVAIEHNPKGYNLAFSGGKDSGVIAKLAEISGVKHQKVYSVTTLDPPELVYHIKKHHEDAIFARKEKALLTTMVEHSSCKGPPTRTQRWCCELYKEVDANDCFKILGVRAEESPRRAKLWKQTIRHRRKNMTIINPVLYWTEEDVWEFHRLNNIPYCSIYSEGWKRLGCVGCPLAGPKGQRREFDRWPRFEKLWRRAFDRFWDKWHGVPKKDGSPRYFEDYGSAQGLWDWWISGKAKGKDGGCMGTLELWG